MSFFWARRHSRMHSLQKTCPLRQLKGSMRGLRQRLQASKGLMESLPSLSFCVPYPNFRFSSYVKKARSLLFFECLWGIFSHAKEAERIEQDSAGTRKTNPNSGIFHVDLKKMSSCSTAVSPPDLIMPRERKAQPVLDTTWVKLWGPTKFPPSSGLT